MAIPAVGLDIVAVVALVAKIDLVDVAAHAGFLQAHGPVAAVSGPVDALAFTNGLVAPGVEQVHMVGAHPFCRLDAGFPFAVRGQGDVRIFVRLAPKVQPERRGKEHDSDHKTGNDVFGMVHELCVLPFRLSCLVLRLGIGIGQIFLAEVQLAGFFTLHDQGVGHKFVQSAHRHARRPVGGHRRERGPVQSADARHPVDVIMQLHMAQGVAAREPGPQAQFHDFLGVEAGTGAAAERFFPNGVRRHFHEVVAHRPQDGARLFQQAHRPGGVARIMECRDDMIVARRLQVELVVVDEVGREFGDVHHFGALRPFKARARDR